MRLGDAHKAWFDEEEELLSVEEIEAFFRGLREKSAARRAGSYGAVHGGDTLTRGKMEGYRCALGVPVHDMGDVRKVMEAQGMRHNERGDGDSVYRREIKEHMGSGATPEARGPGPLETLPAPPPSCEAAVMKIYREKREKAMQ